MTQNINIDLVSQQPRSADSHVVDRLYRSSEYDTPEFGEIYSFTQRYSGFFVPPLSSLYTFNVRSDDQSRLYFSPNASEVALGESPIIDVPQATRSRYVLITHNVSIFVCYIHFKFKSSWNTFPEQIASVPVYLKEGHYYYFELVSNQGRGPWDVGLGAKVHSLSHTSYPYQGDKERQRVNITSAIVREKIVCNTQGTVSVA